MYLQNNKFKIICHFSYIFKYDFAFFVALRHVIPIYIMVCKSNAEQEIHEWRNDF